MMTERRKAKRYRTHGRVELPRMCSHEPLQALLVDVSQAGCGVFVPAGVNFSAEDLRQEVFWLELRFKTSYLTFRAVAAVRSLQPKGERGGALLGLEFVELHARAQADIAALIRDQNELLAA